MASKISSGVLVQVNGLGFLLQALVHWRRSASSFSGPHEYTGHARVANCAVGVL